MASSKYIRIQVANTRFAVRCNFPPFMEWLIERCRNFVSHEKPHLYLKVILEQVSDGWNHDHSVTANWNYGKYSELEFKMVCYQPAYIYEYILHYCLRCAIATKHPPDLLLHSAGVIHEGMTYLFIGESGSGKSTVCKLLAQDSTFTILHDELVSITKTEQGFNVWSTPLNGEMPSNHSNSAPLKAAFFLKHEQENYAIKLSGREAARRFALCLQPPFIVTNGRLEFDAAESLSMALELVEIIPCYELYFRPESGFWEVIPPLFDKGFVPALRKG